MSERIDATLVDATGEIYGSGLVLDNGIVTEIDTSDSHGAPYLLPGLIDVHCHGGGGFSFPDDLDLDSITHAAHVHLAGGTTHLVASTVSLKDPIPAITALAEACDAGILAGIHLEGPFISHEKPGAQNPAVIRDPDTTEFASWLEAGRGWIKTMTIAPERPGALDLARMALSHGAKPSWGHTNATGAQAAEVIAATVEIAQELGVPAPAQTATHLMNAMPPIHHREPGPVREFLAAAQRGEMTVELIGDGVHLNPTLVADFLSILDGEHPAAMLITDAMAGAGMPDGQYSLGGLDVTIDNGVAVLSGTNTIAGGTARLGDEIDLLLNHGVPVSRLAKAACWAPAAVLGIDPPQRATVGQPLTGVVVGGPTRRVWKNGTAI